MTNFLEFLLNVERCLVRESSWTIIVSWVSNSLSIVILSCSLHSSTTTSIYSTFMSSSISSRPISFPGMSSSSSSLFVPLFLLLAIGRVCDFSILLLGECVTYQLNTFPILELKFGVFLWLGYVFGKYLRTMKFCHLQPLLTIYDGH